MCVRRPEGNGIYDHWLIQKMGLPVVHVTVPLMDMEVMGKDIYLSRDGQIYYFQLED